MREQEKCDNVDQYIYFSKHILCFSSTLDKNTILIWETCQWMYMRSSKMKE